MFRAFGRVFAKAARRLSLLPAMAAHGALLVWDRFASLMSEGYRRNAVAYACIRRLATGVAEPPLAVYRDDAEVEGHPLRRLMERPNPHMSEFEFWELVVSHLAICGKAFWWKQRSNMGEPVALWPLRPDRVSPRHDPDTLLAGWTYTLDGKDFPLAVEDVLAFNLPDPGDETGGVVGGLGYLQVLAAEIDTDNEATGHVFSLLRNYAIPGVAVKVKGEVDDDEAEEFKAEFVRRYSGSRRGEPAVIDGEAEIVPLSHTLRELEFPDLRGVVESRICAVIGVPPILVGVKVGLDRSTFSNAAESRRFWTQTTLAEWWRRLSDQMTLALLPDFQGSEGLTTRFRVNGLPAYQEIMAEQAQRYADAFKAGVVTVDEYRAALGLDPLPSKAGQVIYRPVAVIITDTAGKPVQAALPPAPEPPAEEDETEPPDDDGAPPKGRRLKGAPPDRVAAELAARERLVHAHANDLAAAWNAMGERVIARLAKSGPLAERKAEAVLPEDDAVIAAVIAAHAVTGADHGWGSAVVELTSANLDDFPSPAVRARVLDEVGRRIVGINATTRADVARVVTQAMDEGVTLRELEDRLRGLFEQTYRGRAMTVARTESGHHYNLGSVYAYRESGMVEFVTVYDGDSDAACNALNGTRQSLEWAEANPLQHPNCQRVFAPVVVAAPLAA